MPPCIAQTSAGTVEVALEVSHGRTRPSAANLMDLLTASLSRNFLLGIDIATLFHMQLQIQTPDNHTFRSVNANIVLRAVLHADIGPQGQEGQVLRLLVGSPCVSLDGRYSRTK